VEVERTLHERQQAQRGTREVGETVDREGDFASEVRCCPHSVGHRYEFAAAVIRRHEKRAKLVSSFCLLGEEHCPLLLEPKRRGGGGFERSEGVRGAHAYHGSGGCPRACDLSAVRASGGQGSDAQEGRADGYVRDMIVKRR
jgi:hypothetical protein